MRVFPENFDCLGLWEARFGAPKVIGQDMVIPVRQLPFSALHYPLCALCLAKDKAIWQHPAMGEVVNGLLVFREVSLSKRKIYISRDIPPSLIVDIDIPVSNESLNTYSFEGRLNEGITIDSPELSSQDDVGVVWDIIARSFELQVE